MWLSKKTVVTTTIVIMILFLLFSAQGLVTAEPETIVSSPSNRPLLAPTPTPIVVGPWAFSDETQFADDATQLESGSLRFEGGATSLDDALTGYSPLKQIVNIGNPSYANLFQLDFTTFTALNSVGPDIVFFDCRFSSDPYDIAIRPEGGIFTNFISYAESDFIDSTELGARNCELWGLEIDISSYGFPIDTAVDAIQFRAIVGSEGQPDGDPVMAGVLNSIPPAEIIYIPLVFGFGQ